MFRLLLLSKRQKLDFVLLKTALYMPLERDIDPKGIIILILIVTTKKPHIQRQKTKKKGTERKC